MCEACEFQKVFVCVVDSTLARAAQRKAPSSFVGSARGTTVTLPVDLVQCAFEDDVGEALPAVRPYEHP